MNYGSILHAWMWSFNTMKEHMAEIADAGYTSIQTSPISVIKGPVQGQEIHRELVLRLPTGRHLDRQFGRRFRRRPQGHDRRSAQYGIRIIVDAVINHFTSDWNAIEPSWQNASLFHTKSEGGCGNNGTGINYGNRWQSDPLPPARPVGSQYRESRGGQPHAGLPQAGSGRWCGRLPL